MALDGFQVGEFCALNTQQLMPHTQEMFADDIERRSGDQMVNVRDTSGHGIFDRNHSDLRAALGNRGKDIFKRGAWQDFHVGKCFTTRNMRIRSGLALKGNGIVCH